MALEPPSNDKELGTEGILDLLNQETDEEDVKKGKEDEETEDDEDTKKREDKDEDEGEGEEDEKKLTLDGEEEEEELDEDKLDLVVPSRKKEILKEFPNLFKKFPGLEVALFRDRQFVEVFPTVEDAKIAADKSSQLDAIEGDLIKGNTENLIRLVKENDEEAFKKIVDDYLPSLGRIDPNARDHIIGNVIKYTIAAMANKARDNEDQELMDHAVALSEYVFGTKKLSPPRPLSEKKDEDDSLKQERQNFVLERLESTQNELQAKVDNTIKSTIETNIDPKGVMSSFVKKHAVKDAFEKLEDLLIRDKSLESTLNRLWKTWHDEKFSRSALERIRSVYLSKAKTLLPNVIREARIEALKDGGSKSHSSSEDKEPRRGHTAVGRSSSSGNSRGKVEIPKGMSNKDFIMSD